MSDTPRTDARIHAVSGKSVFELSKELERELTAAQSRIAELEASVQIKDMTYLGACTDRDRIREECDRLRTENAGLKEAIGKWKQYETEHALVEAGLREQLAARDTIIQQRVVELNAANKQLAFYAAIERGKESKS